MLKVLVISAHLDDAILSAGQFIAGRGDVDVLTVFAGIPEDRELLTAYDAYCGFHTSRDAMVVRREEDSEACAILNATAYHSSRLDSQYTDKGDYVGLANELREFISAGDYEYVVGPLGLRHPDHVKLADVLIGLKLKNLYLYEDLPHRVTHPEYVFERLSELPRMQLQFIGDGPIADKVRALWCYKSQMARGDLNPYNLYVPERFWKV